MVFNPMCRLLELLMAKWGKDTKIGRAITQNATSAQLIVVKPDI
jgi:hypothetical protein